MSVKNIQKVSGRLPIGDPYIMGAYHYDKYPEGNGKFVPKASLNGHQLGNDFNPDADWRMYHGKEIPGFPFHPHRGFEIITIADEGYADHFDSKGSKGRYGEGDVQLMSAGSGVLHGEMFPLIHEDKPNPLRLFQIWINLPAASKMTEPQYKMLWHEKIPVAQVSEGVNVKVILGEYSGVKSIEPLPYSWAKNPDNHVGVALIDLAPNTSYTLEAKSSTMRRFLFFYDGTTTVQVDEHALEPSYMAELNGGESITIHNNGQRAKFLILEGEPINEPVAAYGPFVMNTQQELEDSFREYRKTQFGGWPWGHEEIDVVHPKDAGRFASYNFGKELDTPAL